MLSAFLPLLPSSSFVILWSSSFSFLSPCYLPSSSIFSLYLQLQPIRNNNPWMLLFFISFLLIVSFFVLNMFVGVVVENFHKCRQQQEEEEARLREEKRQRRLEKRRRSKRAGGRQRAFKTYMAKNMWNVTWLWWLNISFQWALICCYNNRNLAAGICSLLATRVLLPMSNVCQTNWQEARGSRPWLMCSSFLCFTIFMRQVYFCFFVFEQLTSFKVWNSLSNVNRFLLLFTINMDFTCSHAFMTFLDLYEHVTKLCLFDVCEAGEGMLRFSFCSYTVHYSGKTYAK